MWYMVVGDGESHVGRVRETRVEGALQLDRLQRGVRMGLSGGVIML